MNDMETEARHLLAVATEDRPPEIDVLAGFAAARRRDRAQRTRRRSAATIGIAAAAAAVTAVTLTIGTAPSARAAFNSALTSTPTQSFHATTTWFGNSYISSNGKLSASPRTCTYQVDPTRQLQATYCANIPGKFAPAVIVAGGYTYIHNDLPGRTTSYHGKYWERTRSRGSVGPVIDTFNTGALSEILQADTVTVAGPASGPGWTGTRYAYSRKLGTTTFSGTVDVDQQGRTRNLILNVQAGKSPMQELEVVTFSDYGEPVTVTPPPADQVYP